MAEGAVDIAHRKRAVAEGAEADMAEAIIKINGPAGPFIFWLSFWQCFPD